MATRETAEERRGRLARAAAGRTGPAAGPPAAAPMRSVRITVDLNPRLYRRLGQVADHLAGELEVARVHQSEIIRALIRALDEDHPGLTERVLGDLKGG